MVPSQLLSKNFAVNAKVPLTYPQRCLLPLRQDCLWKIHRGVVRTSTWREDGHEITLGLWGPGDVVGRALSSSEHFRMECLTSVEVSVVSINSSSLVQLTEALLLHIQRMGDFLEVLCAKPPDAALLKMLSWLARKFGYGIEEGHLIDLRLTHEDLGTMIGATRVTITRLLNAFEKQGMISRTHRRLILLQDSACWYYEI
jgi:CRP-like cAMP-binding protein